LCVLLCAACGSGTLSASDFRHKANGICTDLQKQTSSLNSLTKRSLDRGIASVGTAITRLQRLRPPGSEQQTYRDFLNRMRLILAFIKVNEPKLIAIEHEIETVKSAPTTRAGARQFEHIAQRMRGLVAQIGGEVRIAKRDARALGLHVCGAGISG
jgi:hypothetical protein